MAAFGALGGILFLLVGIVQIFVGYIGIEHHLGGGFAIGALVLGFVFRIMFPLTIGTFFGALDVWGWPWYGALALAAPGLLFIVPALVTAAISSLVGRKETLITFQVLLVLSQAHTNLKIRLKMLHLKKRKKLLKK